MTDDTAPADQPPGMVNPHTTASLLADYEALQNDLEQANGLAADFQRQLAWKANECAQFKQVFEKTCKDLGHLQTSIAALREERHRLANEAMMVTAYKLKLVKVTEERDRLLAELTAARHAAEVSARAAGARESELTLKLETLREVLTDAQQRSAPPAPRAAAPPRQNARASTVDKFIDIAFDH